MPRIILRNLKPKKIVARKAAPKIKKQAVVHKAIIDKKMAVLKLRNRLSQFTKKYPDIKEGLKKDFEKISSVFLNAEIEISRLRTLAKNNSEAHALINHLNGRKERFFSEFNTFINSSEINLVRFSELEISAKIFVRDATGIKTSLLPKSTEKAPSSSGKGDYNARLHGSK